MKVQGLRPFERTTSPTIDDPAALSDLKEALRIEGDWADLELSRLLNQSIDLAQERTRRQFLTATFKLYLDCWPAVTWIELPRAAPLIGVTQIDYTDDAGSPQVWAATEYDVLTYIEPGRIRLAYEKKYPSSGRDIIVTYTAGYGTTWASLPARLQDCLILMVGHSYYQRDTSKEAGAVEHLLDSLTVGDQW